ncbi:hypothetical protein V1522DRAFT_414922 [Lipomyces starkeyi]
MSLRRESDLTRNSTPSSDQAEEKGKRLKLDQDNTDSDYYKARALLRSNTPEQILEFQPPSSKFLQLENAFSTLSPQSGIILNKFANGE